jgi:hypothetical protein
MAGALSPGLGAPDVVIATAMEPPRNGGSTGQQTAARFIHSMPQWSRRRTAERQALRTVTVDTTAPQWSPPSDGGSAPPA